MNNLTYAEYIANPSVREQLDEEVRQLRHEAVRTLIVVPVRDAMVRVYWRARNVMQRSSRAVHESA